MADNNDRSNAQQGMLQFGQAMMGGFFEFINRQQAAMQQMQNQTNVPVAPLPAVDTEEFARLQQQFAEQHAKLWTNVAMRKPEEAAAPVVHAEPGDRRFNAPEWSDSPMYDYIRQAYLLNSSFLRSVADAMPIADGRLKGRIQYLTRQYIDALAPSNFAATNPEFVKAALETNGESITQGIKNLVADLEKGRISMTDESVFEVGKNLAVTEGAVIYENELIQLIQYAPLTDKVAKVPLLIVPPCINKFYIMDLQPENSLVRYVVEQGFTVFLVSWKNAKAEQAQLTWDDYLRLGPLAALDVVREVTKVDKPNVLGFCVGGTLLSSALGVSYGRGEEPVSSLSLMTTLLDFSDAGELSCLLDEASVATREATIGKGGLLYGKELSGVFSSLRANDLIWNYVVGNYLKGGKPQAFDLLYWNSDGTNLAGPMAAWYLRNMYLENSLRVPGKLEMLGQKVDLSKVTCPSYLMAAREDHIVPWTGAYLARKVLGGDTTFVLGASGHIAGAINPASKNKRSYWTNDAVSSTADEWLAGSVEQKGSWWVHWANWLRERSGEQVTARKPGSTKKYPVIEAAPGRYVKERAE